MDVLFIHVCMYVCMCMCMCMCVCVCCVCVFGEAGCRVHQADDVDHRSLSGHLPPFKRVATTHCVAQRVLTQSKTY